MRWVYNIILILLAVPGVLFFLFKMLITGKYRQSFLQKLGFKQKHLLKNIPPGRRVWIHAVSVGEVTAAQPVVRAIKALCPETRIIFSTSTETGQGMAQRLVGEVDAFIYFPLDLPFAVHRLLDAASPDVFILVETELWPNFLVACRKRGIKVALVNGRISPRSFDTYRRTRIFWKRVLENIDAAGMISEVDASRIRQMGMIDSRIQTLGNAKYDALAAMASSALHDEVIQRFGVSPDEKYFVAGSTHPGEEDIVVSVYRALLESDPAFKLIIVPRHIERTPDVMALLSRAGFTDVISVTQINAGRARRKERILVVDVIGELFKIYSLATIVYCGGSLVPRGGQNILEAAAWGNVIFYGPSMEDFTREAELLEAAGAGIRVAGEQELLAGILGVLSNPDDLRARGERGRAIVIQNAGAAKRYAQMVLKLT